MSATGSRRKKKSALQIYKDLKKDFEGGRFKPVYLFYGGESYFADQLQQILIEDTISPEDRDFDLDVVYGPDVAAKDALGICQMAPMLTERRIVIIREFDKLKGNKLFATLAKWPNPAAVVLLICEGRPKFNADPYYALKRNPKVAQVVEFAPLWRNQMGSFLREHAKSRGYELERNAEQLLIEFLGTGLALLIQEIEKLITYVGASERRVITEQDVLQASGQTREINVFELQDAITDRRRIEAHRIAEQLLLGASSRQGECLRILAVLNQHFLKLWKLHGCPSYGLKPAEIAKRTGIPPNMIYKYRQAARKWPLPEIKRAMQLFLSADSEIKGFSKRSPHVIMTLLILRLLSEPLRY